MRLQVGKLYVAANGKIIGRMQRRTNLRTGETRFESPMSDYHWSEEGHCLTEWASPAPDEWNLLREAQETQTETADASSPQMTKALLLDTAKAAVADRGLNYGRPEDNFERIANLWNAHLANRYADRSEGGTDFSGWDGMLDAADVAQMMVLMKVARLENQPAHLDSWTDIAGYAACGAEITSQTENSS